MENKLTHWNVKCSHGLNDFPCFSPIAIAPSALVESKRPILLHSWEPNGRCLVLLSDLRLRGTIEEEQINGASKSPPG